MRHYIVGFALLGTLLLTGCASPGPKYSEVQKTFPAIAQNSGRIFFYRTSFWGGALRPDIHLNGETIGESVSGQCFYRDVAPGTYTVETHTEASNDVSLLIKAGEVKYVRIDIGMGFVVGHPKPKLVPASEAESEIEDTHYVAQGIQEPNNRAPGSAKH
jgi:hypothetical protein